MKHSGGSDCLAWCLQGKCKLTLSLQGFAGFMAASWLMDGGLTVTYVSVG
jgi:hypothetical protein